MKNSVTKTRQIIKSGRIIKLILALSLILTINTAALNTAVPSAYAGTTGITDLENNLGLDKNSGSNTNNMLGNIISIIAMIARVVGVLLGVYGLYKLIVAFKDQDANGITQGIVLLAVGIILIFFKNIVNAVFGITVN